MRLGLPEKRYCTDNAAMIASEGLIRYLHGDFADLTLNAKASIPLSAVAENREPDAKNNAEGKAHA